jgi:hypothetical protein
MTEFEHEERFRFPDEKEKPEELQIEVEGEGETEIEVVDDTPEPDRNRAPMKEAPAEVTDDELAQYSEGVKKRIQHFSKGYHEERRAKESALREREEALRLAQNLVEENKRLQGSLGQGQQALLEQAKKVVANEVASAKTKLKEAHEAFDTDGIVAAQEELAKAVNKAERVNSFRPPVAKPEEPVVQPAPRAEPQVEAKALAWRDSNPWFGSDDEMTAVALTVHRKLVESGVSTASDEYYEKINSRVRQLFPDAFPSEKPVKKSVVAPATRSTAPRKIVLTQSQVQIAKRLGLTNEQYARAVAEEMRKQNG